MSANSQLVDRMTRHQVFIQRFAGGEARKLLPVLGSLQGAIQKRLGQEDDANVRQRLELMIADVDFLIQEAAGAVQVQMTASLSDFAEYEGEFVHRVVGSTVVPDFTLPSRERLRALVTDSVASLVSHKTIKRKTLDSLFSDYALTQSKQVAFIVRSGVTEGRTLSEISKDVNRLIKTRTRAQTEALVRTSTNHIANQANKLVMQANEALLQGEEWVSVLDGRTTLVCGSRDGRVYPVGQGDYPPAHFGCRSMRIAVVREQYQKPTTDSTREDLSYGQWLRKQSAEFQDEALGADRAALFRRGKLSIDKFTDDIGRTYTLEELRSLEPLAFDEAGI